MKKNFNTFNVIWFFLLKKIFFKENEEEIEIVNKYALIYDKFFEFEKALICE